MQERKNISLDSCSVKHLKEYPEVYANVFISIGKACRPAHWLEACKLRFCALPFDWMFGYSLDTYLKIIQFGM